MTEEIEETISQYDYALQEKLGEGGFATVYKVRHLKYQKIFALKVIAMADNASSTRIESYLNEVTSLEMVVHPNIISIYNYFRDKHNFYIILEYCPNGSLKDRIDKGGSMEKDDFVSITKQLLGAIEYLHKKRISHGDIKPANVLFDEYDRPKLGDFGLSIFHNDLRFLKRSYMCSPAFAAPEILRQTPHDPLKADIWSFGVLCYVMWTGQLPFHFKSIKELIDAANNMDVLIENNEELQLIINHTLLVDPQLRYSAGDLISTPLLTDGLIKVKKIKSVENRHSSIQHLDIREGHKSLAYTSRESAIATAAQTLMPCKTFALNARKSKTGPLLTYTFSFPKKIK